MARGLALVVLAGVLVAASPSPAGKIALDDEKMIRELRADGPAGLARLLDTYADQLAAGPRKDDSWRTLSSAIDVVAAQKDAYASKLYWYTDLEQAKKAAKTEGKPILSLRLLGRLDEELSCANSRFFRTTLYPDPAVSTLLREKFVLHWSSERPVPVVTIDFGDGRVLKRTVTGNSVHYILDCEGRPIDALPGLYSAPMFVGKLNDALAITTELAGLDDVNRASRLRDWHRTVLAKNEVIKAEPVTLSPQVVAVVSAKITDAEPVQRLTVSKAFVETPLVQTLRRLSDSIAQDTVRNESTLHRQIHQWFAASPVGNMAALNARVYAELFLTPRSDPWLGLAPPDVYSAIDQGGLTTVTSAQPAGLPVRLSR